jgi:hypothetical protein
VIEKQDIMQPSQITLRQNTKETTDNLPNRNQKPGTKTRNKDPPLAKMQHAKIHEMRWMINKKESDFEKRNERTGLDST